MTAFVRHLVIIHRSHFSLSHPGIRTVERSAGSGDFQPIDGLRINFTGDDPEVTVSFEVVILMDEIAESTEIFLLQMVEPSAGYAGSAAVISILDDDGEKISSPETVIMS